MQANHIHSKSLKKYWQQYFEITVWVSGMLLLYFMDADTTSPSLCMFRFAGIQHCPGCGLGHAVMEALHCKFTASFQQHPLGIAAVIIILNRIKQLSFKPKPLQQ